MPRKIRRASGKRISRNLRDFAERISSAFSFSANICKPQKRNNSRLCVCSLVRHCEVLALLFSLRLSLSSRLLFSLSLVLPISFSLSLFLLTGILVWRSRGSLFVDRLLSRDLARSRDKQRPRNLNSSGGVVIQSDRRSAAFIFFFAVRALLDGTGEYKSARFLMQSCNPRFTRNDWTGW